MRNTIGGFHPSSSFPFHFAAIEPPRPPLLCRETSFPRYSHAVGAKSALQAAAFVWQFVGALKKRPSWASIVLALPFECFECVWGDLLLKCLQRASFEIEVSVDNWLSRTMFRLFVAGPLEFQTELVPDVFQKNARGVENLRCIFPKSS